MSGNQKLIAGLLLGAVAGAALALFLKSEQGKEILEEVKEEGDLLQEELKTKLKDFDASVNQLLEKGKAFVNDLEHKSKQTPA